MDKGVNGGFFLKSYQCLRPGFVVFIWLIWLS